MSRIPAALPLSVVALDTGQATSLRFDSTVVEARVNTGSGRYAGMSIGATFAGRLDFGNRASDASLCGAGANAALCVFFGSAFGIRIESRGISPECLIMLRAISDGVQISSVEAAFLNELFGTSVTAQTPADSLVVGGAPLAPIMKTTTCSGMASSSPRFPTASSK